MAKRKVQCSQQRGHNHCVCGHLDAHHRLWDSQQACRMGTCSCERFQSKPYEDEEAVRHEEA